MDLFWQHPVQLGRQGSLSPTEEITAKKVLLSTELYCLRGRGDLGKVNCFSYLSNIPNFRLLALLASWNSTAISPLASWEFCKVFSSIHGDCQDWCSFGGKMVENSLFHQHDKVLYVYKKHPFKICLSDIWFNLSYFTTDNYVI